MFDTTHAYLRVGYINSRFEMKTTATVGGVTATIGDNKNLNGVLIGFGADMPVGEMITVGVGYDYSIYKKHTNPVNATVGFDSYKPRTHAFNVVLKYKF